MSFLAVSGVATVTYLTSESTSTEWIRFRTSPEPDPENPYVMRESTRGNGSKVVDIWQIEELDASKDSADYWW